MVSGERCALGARSHFNLLRDINIDSKLNMKSTGAFQSMLHHTVCFPVLQLERRCLSIELQVDKR